jgi:hypothetical protein
MTDHLYDGAPFGQERRGADMFLLFLCEFILGHMGSNSSKADKANGVEGTILIAFVRVIHSRSRVHRKPPVLGEFKIHELSL